MFPWASKWHACFGNIKNTMSTLKLKTRSLKVLDEVNKKLAYREPLSDAEIDAVCCFLDCLPLPDQSLSPELSQNTGYDNIVVWDFEPIWDHIEHWISLFNNLPGLDSSPVALTWDSLGPYNVTEENLIILVNFAPSWSYNAAKRNFQIYLKGDGSAEFLIPTLSDRKKFPELQEFSGGWKEAYTLVVKTIKKGWPLIQFPEELTKLLPK